MNIFLVKKPAFYVGFFKLAFYKKFLIVCKIVCKMPRTI